MPIRLATRSSRWLRILAERQDTTVAAVIRDLRTAPNLAREVARVLDQVAHAEARALLDATPAQPLPLDADWLTKHHYTTLKQARDAQKQIEQERAWAEHLRLQQG